MRDYGRKPEDEMLVVHPPAPSPELVGREPSASAGRALPASVSELAARLGAVTSADERTRLLGAIQGRFGNAFTAEVVKAVERRGSRAPADPPRGGLEDGDQ